MEQVTLNLHFQEDKRISLLEFSSFLYDLNLMYDLLLLNTGEEYSDFKFTHFFYYRDGRPIKNDDKLYVNKATLNSPLFLEICGLIGGIWGLVQIFEKLYNLDANRTIKLQEIEKNKIELRRARQQERLERYNIEGGKFKEELIIKNGSEIYENITSRISRSKFKITDIEFKNPQIDSENTDR